MKQTPKTPAEFDYDLWTTEDGKCMVRVKITGEVTEVDREIMKILRTEEKRIRRSYGPVIDCEGEEDEENLPDTVLSLDALTAGDKDASVWASDPKSYEDEALFNVMIARFKQTLSPLQLSVFKECLVKGVTVREYAEEHGISKSYVSKIAKTVKEKLKDFFKNEWTKLKKMSVVK